MSFNFIWARLGPEIIFYEPKCTLVSSVALHKSGTHFFKKSCNTDLEMANNSRLCI